MNNTCKILLFFLLSSIAYYGQQGNPDSLSVFSDSLSVAADSVSVDSAASGGSDIKDIVYASAEDSLSFDVLGKKMYVYGSGEIKYLTTELKSGHIVSDFTTNEIAAFGVADTSDSTGQSLMNTPVLTEGGEVYEGSSLKYNFKTRRGLISMAKNVKNDSRYEGKKVKKVNENTFFIKDGIYTTCGGDPPHTHFSASEMKVIQNDRIFAKWIFMHIAGIPIPIPLPFGVFPNQSGRRSGIIIPGFGKDYRRGQYFKGFGYYWAISDFMDLSLQGDYYMKGGWGANTRFRYKKRYNYTGSIDAAYSKIIIGEEGDEESSVQTDWRISVVHNQNLTPTSSLNVNMYFQSRSYLQNTSTNYSDVLRKNIVSNATYNKRWDESGNSMSINYSRNQNIEDDIITENLPSMNFNIPTSYPFRKKGGGRDMDWYEYIGYSYNGQFKNQRKFEAEDMEVKGGIQHSVNLSASPKLGYFNISPSIRYNEKWYDKHIKKEFITVNSSQPEVLTKYASSDSLVTREVKELGFVRTFDFSLSASTKLYGMFPVGNFGIDAFRHTVSPSISYNYRPDFSEEQWGYYDYYTDSTGEKTYYDKFSEGIFTGATKGESQSVRLSVGNLFEMKTLKDQTDTTSEAKKYNLLNLSAGVGYNFAADSLNLSDLSLSYRTSIGDILDFNGRSSYTFYDYDSTRQVNRFLLSRGKGLFRIRNFSLSMNLNISGDKISGEERTGEEQVRDPQLFDEFAGSEYISLYDERPPDFSIPWSIRLGLNYSYSQNTPVKSDIRTTANISASVNLTKNWKITASGGYDFEKHDITAPRVTVFRDLDCWEMNFSWMPMGTYRGYRFEIRMKAPTLRDIKVEKSGGLYSGR